MTEYRERRKEGSTVDSKMQGKQKENGEKNGTIGGLEKRKEMDERRINRNASCVCTSIYQLWHTLRFYRNEACNVGL